MKGRNWITVAIVVPVAAVILLVSLVLPVLFVIYFLGALLLTLGALTGEGQWAMPFAIPMLVIIVLCYCKENVR